MFEDPPTSPRGARESEMLLGTYSNHEIVVLDASTGSFEVEAASTPPSKQVPPLVWVQLAFAVLAISTAAVAFRELPDTPPFLLASWRMQTTSIILAFGAGYQGWNETRELLLRWLHSFPLLMVSGVCLAAHFGLWVWGLQNTSLPHSLLLVCCTPLLLSFGSLALCLQISAGEIASSVLGALGVALMAADVGQTWGDDAVTWFGDVMSLGAAAAIIGYMLIGHQLRQWMPLFLYVFPVTLTAAVVLAVASALVEDAGVLTDRTQGGQGGHAGIFGWTTDLRSFVVTAYLALGPGLVGHTGYNQIPNPEIGKLGPTSFKP
mmetsp:Transcript_45309/g.72729  ORF Transcript_45309/g.72729 Transcript_45309/m.72729 type:complete len:320 (-) Transcript_45309:285-1244(-)